MAMLFWTVLGFCGGAIVSQNSRQMTDPQISAIFLAVIAAAGITFWIGYRGKSQAVATAIATATAIAKAEANANARAAASSAINLYLGQQNGVTPEIFGSIVDQSVEEINEYHPSVLSFDHPSFQTVTEKETSS